MWVTLVAVSALWGAPGLCGSVAFDDQLVGVTFKGEVNSRPASARDDRLAHFAAAADETEALLAMASRADTRHSDGAGGDDAGLLVAAAEEGARALLALAEGLLGGEAEAPREMARAWTLLGRALGARGLHDRALIYFRMALEARWAVARASTRLDNSDSSGGGGGGSGGGIDGSAGSDGSGEDAPDWEVAGVMQHLATSILQAGDAAGALPYFKESLRQAVAIKCSSPPRGGSSSPHGGGPAGCASRAVARAHANLAACLRSLGRVWPAKESEDRAAAILARRRAATEDSGGDI